MRRDAQMLTLKGAVATVDVSERRVEFDSGASAKALRIRHSILTGQ